MKQHDLTELIPWCDVLKELCRVKPSKKRQVRGKIASSVRGSNPTEGRISKMSETYKSNVSLVFLFLQSDNHKSAGRKTLHSEAKALTSLLHRSGIKPQNILRAFVNKGEALGLVYHSSFVVQQGESNSGARQGSSQNGNCRSKVLGPT